MRSSLICLLMFILILAGAANAAVTGASGAVEYSQCSAPTVLSTSATVDTGHCYLPGELSGVPVCGQGCTLATSECTGLLSSGAGSTYSCIPSSQSSCALSQQTYNPANTIALALLALTISLDVVAIAYVINKLVPTTGIRDWINTEYWEIAKTAMLIIGIYAALALLGNIAASIAPSNLFLTGTSASSSSASASSAPDFTGMTNLVYGACSYLNGESTYMGSTLSFLVGLAESMGVIKQTIISWAIPIPLPTPVPSVLQSGFSMNLYWNKMISSEVNQGTYQSLLNDILMLVVFPVTLVIEAQLKLLPILFALGLGALIPLGLLLRAFPFVRGIGGTLIAIGIGVSLIYPATLVLFNYPITIALQGPVLTTPPATYQCTYDWLTCGALQVVSGTIHIFQVPGAGSAQADTLAALNNIFPAFNDILYYSSYTILQFFLFIMDLVIIFPLVDNIAKMLGGKISLSIGGRLKLI